MAEIIEGPAGHAASPGNARMVNRAMSANSRLALTGFHYGTHLNPSVFTSKDMEKSASKTDHGMSHLNDLLARLKDQ